MPKKNVNKNGFIINDTYGFIVDHLHSDNDKCYAVIAKCGHCGTGYFIPIMFTQKCKDIKTAIEATKATAMVKRDRKDCILDAFEITPLEKFCIDSINDHDEYLKGYLYRNTLEIEKRRVLGETMMSYYISENTKRAFQLRTAEEYDKFYVLEQYFAPYFQGGQMIFPRKVNREELVHDFIKSGCIRYGLLREKYFFVCLYYQLYGEDNDLKIIKHGNSLFYKKFGKIIECKIPENIAEQVNANIQAVKKKEEKPVNNYSSNKPIQRKSQIDKFNERMKKHQEFNNSNQDEPERD